LNLVAAMPNANRVMSRDSFTRSMTIEDVNSLPEVEKVRTEPFAESLAAMSSYQPCLVDKLKFLP
jgi:hypothetical protein